MLASFGQTESKTFLINPDRIAQFYRGVMGSKPQTVGFCQLPAAASLLRENKVKSDMLTLPKRRQNGFPD
jgi:hypothetical protein